MDICRYAFVEIHRLSNIKTELRYMVDSGWLSQVSVSLFTVKKKKSTILVSEIDSKGGYVCVETGEYMGNLYLLLNFIINLKLLFENFF